MRPRVLHASSGVFLALGIVDLAWLDASAARLPFASASDVALAPPPRPAEPVAPALPVSAATVTPPAPAPSTYVVHFATAKAELPAEEAAVLASVVSAVAGDPSAVVRVEGHADRRGPKAFNLGLSERRAASVAEWLAAHGVSDGQIRASGAGDARPLDDGDSAEALQRNRRVEVRVERGVEP